MEILPARSKQVGGQVLPPVGGAPRVKETPGQTSLFSENTRFWITSGAMYPGVPGEGGGARCLWVIRRNTQISTQASFPHPLFDKGHRSAGIAVTFAEFGIVMLRQYRGKCVLIF